MADAVTTQTLLDGSKNVVMQFTNISDGTGESDATKVDVSTLLPAASEVKITGIRYSTNGMGVQILWDATANVLAYTIPADAAGDMDLRNGGGLINNAGAGVTGDVLFTTSGHAAGDSYSITLEMAKR